MNGALVITRASAAGVLSVDQVAMPEERNTENTAGGAATMGQSRDGSMHGE